MTKREFYVAITNGEMNEEIMEQASHYLEKLDAELEKRRNTRTKKQEENELLKNDIVEKLTAEPQTATVIGELFEISTQKASALLRQLVDDGRAIKEDVKISGKGTQKAYTKA